MSEIHKYFIISTLYQLSSNEVTKISKGKGGLPFYKHIPLCLSINRLKTLWVSVRG